MRFHDETAGQYTANNYHAVSSYKPGSYLNAKNINYNPANFLDAALAGTGEAVNGGGPIWTIFDAEAVKREQWTMAPPYVDPDGYFYSQTHSPPQQPQLSTSISVSPCPAPSWKAPWRTTICLSTLEMMRFPTSPHQSIKSRRQRSTRRGPCRLSTTREPGFASTASVRSSIFPAT